MSDIQLLDPPIAAAPQARDATAAAARLAAGVARSYAARTSFDFSVIDWDTGEISGGPAGLLRYVPLKVLQRLHSPTTPRILHGDGGLFLFSAPVPGDLDGRFAAVGCAVAEEPLAVATWNTAATRSGWSTGQFREWVKRHAGFSERALHRILTLAADGLRQETSLRRSTDEADSLANQVNALLGEITFLHDLTAQLRLSMSPHELARRGAQQLCRTIGAQGCGVWLQDGAAEPAWITAGRLPVEPALLPVLLAEFDRHDWTRPLVRNARNGRPLCKTVPGLRNVVIAPLKCTGRTGGWLVAANAPRDANFGTIEASMAASVATVLATHVQNVSLYRENGELLLSFVRSLVSTIDAKDAYTRGHSIRVAAVARELSARLGLDDEQQQAIHLSGLLHDIGKIGVDDAILRKPGKLTDEEFEQIKRHPVIGCQILADLKGLEHVLPGVMHHHENFDGTGYPDRLAGPQIPRMARILAVADAFDAMRSDRPYRAGLTADQVASILESGAGRQWDPAIIRAFSAARGDLERVWQTTDHGPAPARFEVGANG